MRAEAPGKLVLSGAYSVFEGAPALVGAVDRYVRADAERECTFVTREVGEAVRRGVLVRPVWFDAAALREQLPNGESRKLGLGSSAAILVASMAAGAPERFADAELAGLLFPEALAIHRAAQGGGSGIDVAASCFGGVTVCRVVSTGLEVAPVTLPRVVFEAWACPDSVTTAAMLLRVRAFATAEPPCYRRVIGAAKEAAEVAALASSANEFVAAMVAQRAALAELGTRAGVAIMTPAVDALHAMARLEGAVFYPSGAGGGDVALFLGHAASTIEFRSRAHALGLFHLALRIGASGVRRS